MARLPVEPVVNSLQPIATDRFRRGLRIGCCEQSRSAMIALKELV
jgi:hypothetical protein